MMLWICQKEFKLLNIKTYELFNLNYTFDQLTQIVVLILKGKYEKVEFKTDSVFVNDSIDYMNKTAVNYHLKDG